MFEMSQSKKDDQFNDSGSNRQFLGGHPSSYQISTREDPKALNSLQLSDLDNSTSSTEAGKYLEINLNHFYLFFTAVNRDEEVKIVEENG